MQQFEDGSQGFYLFPRVWQKMADLKVIFCFLKVS